MANARQFLAARTAAWAKAGEVHTRLPYLHINENQYLTTDIRLSGELANFDEVDASMRVTGVGGAYDWYFGGWTSVTGDGSFIRRDNAYNRINCAVYTFAQSQRTINVQLPFSSFLKCGWRKVSDLSAIMYVGSSEFEERKRTDGNDFTAPFCIGGMDLSDTGGAVSYYGSKFDLEYLTISRNGTVIHSFIPVHNNATQRNCFFDEITDRYYYSSAGGDFAYP